MVVEIFQGACYPGLARGLVFQFATGLLKSLSGSDDKFDLLYS